MGWCPAARRRGLLLPGWWDGVRALDLPSEVMARRASILLTMFGHQRKSTRSCRRPNALEARLFDRRPSLSGAENQAPSPTRTAMCGRSPTMLGGLSPTTARSASSAEHSTARPVRTRRRLADECRIGCPSSQLSGKALSMATRRSASDRCKYRVVVAMLEWPIRRWTT